ncbi:MAG TPA: hypothetical protein VJH71_01920 [Candidatus Paceibacterota bacterium]
MKSFRFYAESGELFTWREKLKLVLELGIVIAAFFWEIYYSTLTTLVLLSFVTVGQIWCDREYAIFKKNSIELIFSSKTMIFFALTMASLGSNVRNHFGNYGIIFYFVSFVTLVFLLKIKIEVWYHWSIQSKGKTTE